MESPMKKKTKGIFSVILVLTLSGFIFTSCKQHSHGDFCFDYVTEVLDLDKKQTAKLEAIRTEVEAQIEELHKDKAEMHKTLKQQLLAETIDENVIKKMVKEHRNKMQTITDSVIERLIDFHGDLNSEQREKLVKKLEKFEKRHSRHFGH